MFGIKRTRGKTKAQGVLLLTSMVLMGAGIAAANEVAIRPGLPKAGAQGGGAPAIGGDGRAIPTPPTPESEALDESQFRPAREPVLDHRSILLDLPRLAPRSRFPDSILTEVASNEWEIPGSVVTSYKGVYQIAVRRVLGAYRS